MNIKKADWVGMNMYQHAHESEHAYGLTRATMPHTVQILKKAKV